MSSIKVFLAEFIGTFALVFVGAAAGVYSGSLGLLGIALAHGLTLAVFAYAYGHISGTHINPAVTLGLAANGNIKWSDAVVYWFAQLLGGVAAAFTLHLFLNPLSPGAITGAITSGGLTADFPWHALAVEALLTFFLVNAVLHTAVDGKAGPFAGWAIGTTLAIAIIAGGPLTGASLNPARSFGPALVTYFVDTANADVLDYMFYLIYFIGPFLGSILAVLLYQVFKSEPVSMDEMEDIEVVQEEPVKKPAARKSKKK
jgi:MIP family channel proteins